MTDVITLMIITDTDTYYKFKGKRVLDLYRGVGGLMGLSEYMRKTTGFD